MTDTEKTSPADTDLIRAFQEKIAVVSEATRQVEAGNMPDVSQLEKDVETLCQQAGKCSPEGVRSIRALMAILIDRLETLAIRIKEKHDRHITPS